MQAADKQAAIKQSCTWDLRVTDCSCSQIESFNLTSTRSDSYPVLSGRHGGSGSEGSSHPGRIDSIRQLNTREAQERAAAHHSRVADFAADKQYRSAVEL